MIMPLMYLVLYAIVPFWIWKQFNYSKPFEIFIKIIIFYMCMALGTVAGYLIAYMADPTIFKGVNLNTFDTSFEWLEDDGRSALWLFLVPAIGLWYLFLIWLQINFTSGSFILYGFELATLIYLIMPLNNILNVVFYGLFDKPFPVSEPTTQQQPTKQKSKKNRKQQ